MKRTILVLLSVTLLLTIGFFVNNKSPEAINEIAVLRKQHETFLRNSPFSESLKLTKAERKAKRLPPNKYFERQWELTMNPKTGKPEPEKLFELQNKLSQQRLFGKMPGESVTDAWVERGPNNVGGRTRAIMYDPNDGANGYKRVFAGGVSGGLWVNNDITNANSSWSEVGIPQNLAISCITHDPNDTMTFYVGTGESYVQGDVNGNGVWKSTDGGTNWNRVFGGLTANGEGAKVVVNSPASIAGEYAAVQASFGSPLSKISGNLVLINDGTISPIEGCKAITNAGAISGNIAVIERGSCNFDEKVKNAENAGAIAVLMVNHGDGSEIGAPIIMGGDDMTIYIPAIMVSQTDGQAIIAELVSGVNVTFEPDVIPSIGGYYHVSGIQHINDIVIKDNGGASEIYVAAAPSFYTESTPAGVLGFGNHGMYKSLDNGITWSKITLPPTEAEGDEYIPNDLEIGIDGTIWLSTTNLTGSTSDGSGTILSSSDGSTFAVKSTITDGQRVEIAVSSFDANRIYVLAELSSEINGVEIIRTDDGFATEVTLTLPNDADSGIPSTDFTRGQANYDLMIEVDPSNDEIVYVGGIDLFRSINAGSAIGTTVSWSQISRWSTNPNLNTLVAPFVHADQHAFVFDPTNSNKAVIGNDGGVYYSADLSNSSSPSAISARNKNYNTVQFYKGAIGQEVASEKLLAGSQDNGTQLINNATSGVNSSTEIRGGDGCYVFIDKDSEYLIASYVYNRYDFRDYLTGAFKYTINNSDSGDFINQAGLDSENNILYTNGTTDSTYQINRYALGLNSADETILSDTKLDGSPTAFKASTFTTTTLFVGTDNSKLIKLTNANGSPIWTNISGPKFYGSISCIELGITENDIFVTFHNYGVISIFYTNDGGATWLNKEGNLPDLPVTAILMNPFDADEVIIGTDLGVWGCPDFSDATPNWTQSQNGMKDVKVTSFDLRTADATVLASTYGRGMFTGKFTNVKSTLSVDNFSQNDLIKVYPTVSRGELKISPIKGVREGNLAVFDINGRQVYKSKIKFDGNREQEILLNVSSGIYFVKFSSKNLLSTHKIIIE